MRCPSSGAFVARIRDRAQALQLGLDLVAVDVHQDRYEVARTGPGEASTQELDLVGGALDGVGGRAEAAELVAQESRDLTRLATAQVVLEISDEDAVGIQ